MSMVPKIPPFSRSMESGLSSLPPLKLVPPSFTQIFTITFTMSPFTWKSQHMISKITTWKNTSTTASTLSIKPGHFHLIQTIHQRLCPLLCRCLPQRCYRLCVHHVEIEMELRDYHCICQGQKNCCQTQWWICEATSLNLGNHSRAILKHFSRSISAWQSSVHYLANQLCSCRFKTAFTVSKCNYSRATYIKIT